jgi:hypothetical protein
VPAAIMEAIARRRVSLSVMLSSQTYVGPIGPVCAAD